MSLVTAACLSILIDRTGPMPMVTSVGSFVVAGHGVAGYDWVGRPDGGGSRAR